MGFLRVSGELLATTSPDHQSNGSLATLTDGRFVVVWEDQDPTRGDAQPWSVRGQIFNADGSRASVDFLVNTTTSDYQVGSTVAALAGGRFAVTWTDYSETGDDTSATAIRAQLFNADGSKSGAEFLVNTTTVGIQNISDLTALADGRFLVTWTDNSATGDDTSESAIRAQLFNADGSKSGGEFLVNTTTASFQSHSKATVLKDGRFVVTWSDMSEAGVDASKYGIRGQIFSANGSKYGDEFLVNTTTAEFQLESDVTLLADGRFVVTWTDTSQTGGDTDEYAIRGQIFSSSGVKSGSEFLVNTTTTSYQTASSVTALADGRFVVTWTDQSGTGTDTNESAVRAQIFAADGSKSGREFVVNTRTDYYQFDSNVTALADGRFVVTWSDSSEMNDSGVRMQIFDATIYDGDATDETVTGGQLADTIYGNGGNDVLRGGAGNDRLDGGDGNDRLDGGAAIDQLRGGLGDDVYVVDNASDIVIEAGGQGTDTVSTSTSYVLSSGVSVEILQTTNAAGASAINLTANEYTETIVGNAGNNTIVGNDVANFIQGGRGADVMHGLRGNDIYYVDNVGDVVIEEYVEDTDMVVASISYTLNWTVGVEILRTTSNGGTAAINLTGNVFDQTIIGNAGANVIRGGGGTDTMQGLAGDDTYYVDSAGDLIIERSGQGTDTVLTTASYVLGADAQVETLRTASDAGRAALSLSGNNLSQSIIGNAGNNVLVGKGGNDFLTGLGGYDTFRFNASFGAGNVDTISDFSSADDTIQLENAIFVALSRPGVLAAAALQINATGLAAQADDRIIYNSATGDLFYDSDGLGGAGGVLFANLSGAPTLTAADFVVI